MEFVSKFQSWIDSSKWQREGGLNDGTEFKLTVYEEEIGPTDGRRGGMRVEVPKDEAHSTYYDRIYSGLKGYEEPSMWWV